MKYFYSFLALSFNSIFIFLTEGAQYECSYRRTAHHATARCGAQPARRVKIKSSHLSIVDSSRPNPGLYDRSQAYRHSDEYLCRSDQRGCPWRRIRFHSRSPILIRSDPSSGECSSNRESVRHRPIGEMKWTAVYSLHCQIALK